MSNAPRSACELLAFRTSGTGAGPSSRLAVTFNFAASLVRIVRLSGEALRYSAQEERISGGTIRVFSPAKTVADCFKFRHKIGLDVALEALRESYRQKKASMDELWEAAKVCRVANVMRPYLESLR